MLSDGFPRNTRLDIAVSLNSVLEDAIFMQCRSVVFTGYLVSDYFFLLPNLS